MRSPQDLYLSLSLSLSLLLLVFPCCVVSFILIESLMYIIMIATSVAQEQDRCILLQLQKEWDKLAPLPQQQNYLTTHHTSLCARDSVVCVRRE